ncbi:hypothetical protein [Mycetocola saprophilus]|uniref:hypothetical protein n=1 Tax=Mycetocola saprophilus TaxID=76636 RepID=UPI003BF41F2A
MTIIDLAVEAANARKFRQRLDLDQLDYRRELVRLIELGASQNQLSRVLRITQPSLSSAMKTAVKVTRPREGFSGADPYELCQRFAVGELTREQVTEELSRWDYVAAQPVENQDYFDDLRFSKPGSFDDVVRAFDDGLIDGTIYDAVLAHVAAGKS